MRLAITRKDERSRKAAADYRSAPGRETNIVIPFRVLPSCVLSLASRRDCTAGIEESKLNEDTYNDDKRTKGDARIRSNMTS
jgi:hypothetical protein